MLLHLISFIDVSSNLAKFFKCDKISVSNGYNYSSIKQDKPDFARPPIIADDSDDNKPTLPNGIDLADDSDYNKPTLPNGIDLADDDDNVFVNESS